VQILLLKVIQPNAARLDLGASEYWLSVPEHYAVLDPVDSPAGLAYLDSV